ncbi:MAG: hypothetical protein AVDCRST_MAG68-2874, partial [uncultured Gemmatimonadetes bacterium]
EEGTCSASLRLRHTRARLPQAFTATIALRRYLRTLARYSRSGL